jgi:aryl-alcohol dehydrogenase-like predicted oxidoreductase
MSVIGYGAWEAGGADWGPNESEDVVIEAMRAALDAGIDWIDTAEVYGKGVSESLVGRAVAARTSSSPRRWGLPPRGPASVRRRYAPPAMRA